jgi:hypothetical protein
MVRRHATMRRTAMPDTWQHPYRPEPALEMARGIEAIDE